MKTAIITGATGFVGLALVKKLASNGIRVYAVVRNIEKAKELTGLKNVEVIQCDMSKYNELNRYITEEIDVFYHFAWSGTTGSMRASYDNQLNNIKYTCDAIKTCIKLNVKKFIFAGSIIEYECKNALEHNNENISLNNVYGICKSSASDIGKIFADSLGIKFIHLIISNIYGVGEINDRLFKGTLKKLLNNEDTCFTSCEQLYDFIYIDDAIEALFLIGENINLSNEYYIGNKEPRKLKSFIYEMRDSINPALKLGIGKMKFNGIGLKYTEFDTKTLYREYNFESKISFTDGINKTKKWLLEEGND